MSGPIWPLRLLIVLAVLICGHDPAEDFWNQVDCTIEIFKGHYFKDRRFSWKIKNDDQSLMPKRLDSPFKPYSLRTTGSCRWLACSTRSKCNRIEGDVAFPHLYQRIRWRTFHQLAFVVVVKKSPSLVPIKKELVFTGNGKYVPRRFDEKMDRTRIGREKEHLHHQALPLIQSEASDESPLTSTTEALPEADESRQQPKEGGSVGGDRLEQVQLTDVERELEKGESQEEHLQPLPPSTEMNEDLVDIHDAASTTTKQAIASSSPQILSQIWEENNGLTTTTDAPPSWPQSKETRQIFENATDALATSSSAAGLGKEAITNLTPAFSNDKNLWQEGRGDHSTEFNYIPSSSARVMVSSSESSGGNRGPEDMEYSRQSPVTTPFTLLAASEEEEDPNRRSAKTKTNMMPSEVGDASSSSRRYKLQSRLLRVWRRTKSQRRRLNLPEEKEVLESSSTKLLPSTQKPGTAAATSPFLRPQRTQESVDEWQSNEVANKMSSFISDDEANDASRLGSVAITTSSTEALTAFTATGESTSYYYQWPEKQQPPSQTLDHDVGITTEIVLICFGIVAAAVMAVISAFKCGWIRQQKAKSYQSVKLSVRSNEDIASHTFARPLPVKTAKIEEERLPPTKCHSSVPENVVPLLGLDHSQA